MDRSDAMFPLLSNSLPIVTRLLLKTLHFVLKVAIGLPRLRLTELHEDFRVVCRRLPHSESELRAIFHDISVLLLH